MNILAVDDERLVLALLEDSIRQAAPNGRLAAFSSSGDALRHARGNPVDIAFLDIHIDEMNGLVLAKALKDIRGDTNIVFVTGYEDYMMDAFRMHASGYVKKPVRPDDIRDELENLRHLPPAAKTGVRVVTFGNFEVFKDGRPVLFRRSRSKEILAYLVDRCGAGVTKRDLANVLWEDGLYTRSREQQLQQLISIMLTTLEEVGADNLVIRRRNYLAVNPGAFDCDLYRYQAWDPAAVNAYRGEYMTSYSWGEFTAAHLESMKMN